MNFHLLFVFLISKFNCTIWHNISFIFLKNIEIWFSSITKESTGDFIVIRIKQFTWEHSIGFWSVFLSKASLFSLLSNSCLDSEWHEGSKMLEAHKFLFTWIKLVQIDRLPCWRWIMSLVRGDIFMTRFPKITLLSVHILIHHIPTTTLVRSLLVRIAKVILWLHVIIIIHIVVVVIIVIVTSIWGTRVIFLLRNSVVCLREVVLLLLREGLLLLLVLLLLGREAILGWFLLGIISLASMNLGEVVGRDLVRPFRILSILHNIK